MILKLSTFLLLLVVTVATQEQSCSTAQVYTASSDEYLFSILPLTPVALFDGPTTITNTSTSPSPIATQTIPQEELNYYMYFSAAMYCPYTLPTFTCCYCNHFNSNVSTFKLINSTEYNTLAMVSVHPSKEEIVVTFRGSVTITNFLVDFTFVPTSLDSNVKVHTGFHLSLMSVYNEVVKELYKQASANPNFRVVVNGHSLGGAMASLFVYFMKSRDQFPLTNFVLATYGQPRTGNQGYADYMNGLDIPMARVTARADIIPHAVPVNALGVTQVVMGMYYMHHGQEVWINGHTITYCSKTIYEDPSCSNSMGPTYTVADHLQYFDVDTTQCYYVEGWGSANLLTLPGGYEPTSYMPPMPSKMYGFFSPIVQGGYQGLLPLL